MVKRSETAFFFLLSLIWILFPSCNRKNDVVPDVYVDFSIDLNNPYFSNLTVFGGVTVITATSPVASLNKTGYNGNGIIVFAGVDEYFAYDCTCPHDYVLDGSSVQVTIDKSSSIFAVCPKCGTKYALSANGTPASGVGRYPLKNYRAYLIGNSVYVRNY